jgi:hypothetical protein
VTDVDFAAFNAATGRQKSVDAFDALDLSAGENSEFGTATVDKQHFTAYGLSHSTAEGSTMADAGLIRMMNPMSYIGQSGNTVAKNFRIRYGTADSNTSEAIEMIFATKLRNNGANVDIAFRGASDIPATMIWTVCLPGLTESADKELRESKRGNECCGPAALRDQGMPVFLT